MLVVLCCRLQSEAVVLYPLSSMVSAVYNLSHNYLVCFKLCMKFFPISLFVIPFCDVIKIFFSLINNTIFFIVFPKP